MGLFTRKTRAESELTEILQGYELPSFSAVVVQVLALLRDPSSEISAISREINRDPALVLGIFKQVNSAGFGLRRRVDDIRQAVLLLGRARLESQVLLQAIKSSSPNQFPQWFNSKQFWQTSAKRAVLARHLAERLHPANASHAFTAGMLQDMGIPVIASSLAAKYEKVSRIVSSEPTKLLEVEKEILTFDHQMIGKLMAQEWNLPDQLLHDISDHHQLTVVEPAISLVSLIHTEDLNGSVKELARHCESDYSISVQQAETMASLAFQESEGFF